MKKILVPFDFSKTAINAYRSALDIAKQAKGSVYLLYVIELPVLHDTVLMPVLNFEQQLLDELKDKAGKNFAKITEKYDHGETKIHSIVQFGSMLNVVREFSVKHDIDLVVMGSHGTSGMRELLIGSNAEKMIRHSPVPVLIIKGYSSKAIENIVFPTKLQEDANDDVIKKIKTLQKFFNAKLHIVKINTPSTFTSDTTNREKFVAFTMMHKFTNYTINVFNHTDEEKGILDFAKSVNADLIAIGTHGRRGLAHLLNGSLAEDLANHTTSMVWTYNLQQESE